MNTVLIVTIWDKKNIGNRLQAVALKEMLKCLGYDTTFAIYNRENKLQLLKRVIKEAFGFFGILRYQKMYFQRCRRKAMNKNEELFCPKTKIIRSFNTKGCINSSDYLVSICGSDQVWHKWSNNKHELPYFYLTFMPPEKRISYAASFGFEEFPTIDFNHHMAGLQGMRFISCRESSGCKLVEQMTGKPGELVLDPTLCVGLKFWESLEEIPEYANDHYLLLFLLGKQDKYRNTVEKYAEEHSLTIIDLYDTSRIDVWKTTIGGFLWLVHHADMICTDSFHCTVFSILYEKPFQVFRRQQKGFENMYDRIETLLSLTALESCQYDGKSVKKVNVDYLNAKNKIDVERKESIQWLQHALRVVSDEQY